MIIHLGAMINKKYFASIISKICNCIVSIFVIPILNWYAMILTVMSRNIGRVF